MKVARWVLRGVGSSNTARLPDLSMGELNLAIIILTQQERGFKPLSSFFLKLHTIHLVSSIFVLPFFYRIAGTFVALHHLGYVSLVAESNAGKEQEK